MSDLHIYDMHILSDQFYAIHKNIQYRNFIAYNYVWDSPGALKS